MNRVELKQRLVDSGVDPDNYLIDGVDPPIQRGDGEYTLEPAGNGWVVFQYERGVRYNEHLFDTEDAACEYLWETLRPKHTALPPRQLGTDERARAAEAAKRKKEEYLARLAAKGVLPGGAGADPTGTN